MFSSSLHHHRARSIFAMMMPLLLISFMGFRETVSPVEMRSHIASLATTHQANSSDLQPGPGPVQHHPRVYLIFWGSDWLKDPTGTIPVITNLFNDLGGGDYNNILSQYSDGNDYIHNDTVLAAPPFIDTSPLPSNPLNEANIYDVAQYTMRDQILNKQWTNSPDTQVLVFPEHDPAGYNWLQIPANVCGAHSYTATGIHVVGNLVAGYVIFQSDNSSCNKHGMPAEMSLAASHEYAEMATDPQANGTWTVGGNSQTEVGDLCNNIPYLYPPLKQSSVNILVQQLWDNSTHSCVQNRGIEYRSTASPGVHTVQGSILDEYDYILYSQGGFIGVPITEEIPLGNGLIWNGHVSYFSNQICNGGYSSNHLTSGSAIYDQNGFSAHEVHGCIYHAYTAIFGGPEGMLGFPVSDEQASVRGGRVSYFAGQVCNGGGPFNSGSAIYHYNYTDYEVHGCIFNKYWNLVNNGPGSALGFPTSNEGGVTSGYSGIGARTNTFEHGAIFWTAAMGAFAVQGSIYAAYMSRNGAAGQLGLPTSDEYTNKGGLKESDFEYGYITFNPANGQVTIITPPCC